MVAAAVILYYYNSPTPHTPFPYSPPSLQSASHILNTSVLPSVFSRQPKVHCVALRKMRYKEDGGYCVQFNKVLCNGCVSLCYASVCLREGEAFYES
ncbi:hypothetical protein E2C01_017220 [Portunus trituberculatus]|uniref:Uncharacterized protein n=1 Tax=Portunus trituberculatus TaxID=210409 RepID=A0A5B7DSL0_PORTR|nr:hypothetical protein [Portunus trituberculatus]